MSVNGPARDVSRSPASVTTRKPRAASRKVASLVGTAEPTPQAMTLDAMDSHLRSIGTAKATKVLASLVYKLIMRG